MPLGINLTDPKTNHAATVTKFGQLVVAPLDYSTPVFDEIDIVDTAFNFIAPASGQSIVITDILLNGTRSLPVNGAIIDVYETSSAVSTTVDVEILRTDLSKQQIRDVTGQNLLVPEGKWVNVKSDGATAFVTIMFYRVPVKGNV